MAVTILDGVTATIADVEWVSENLPAFDVYTTLIVLRTLYELSAHQFSGASVRTVLAAPKRQKGASSL